MNETADIIEAQIEKFDELRATFCDKNIRCFLLKRVSEGVYSKIIEIEAGWYFRWDEYRQQMKLPVATADAEFQDFQAQATHFGVGVPDTSSEIDIYATQDDRRDRVPPNGANPFWKFYLLRVENERFEIPE